MIITKEQEKILNKYGVTVYDDVNDTLIALDAKMTEIGFDKNYNLNAVGLQLQKLYDTLYHQNCGSCIQDKYNSICKKLGFDPLNDNEAVQKRYQQKDPWLLDDSKPSLFAVLNDEEKDFLFEVLFRSRAKKPTDIQQD